MIYEGDTAWPLCHELSKAGVKEIALPSTVYRTGRLPEEVPSYGLEHFTVDAVKEQDVGALYRRLARLSDCVFWLLRNRGTTPVSA